MDMQRTIQTPEPDKKKQVNAQLESEVADAFDRYLRDSGIGTVSAAVRSLMVPELRRLGYLPPVQVETIEMAA